MQKDTKALRQDLGLTQQDFSALLGVSLSTVQRWEAGKSKPSRMAVRLMEEIKKEGKN